MPLRIAAGTRQVASRFVDPRSIAGCQLWLPADAITGLADAAAVATFPDWSGNGRDALQATPTNQPSYRTNVLNGLPVVRFDATNDRMQTAAFTALTQPTTIFAVFKWASLTGLKGLYDGLGNGFRHLLYRDATPITHIGAPTDSAGGTPNTNWNVVDTTYNGAATVHVVNGLTVVTVNGGTNTLTGITLGSNYVFSIPADFDLAEFIVYNPAPSVAERRIIRRYLGRKYALTVGGL